MNQFKGQELEGFVAQNLRAWIDYRNKKDTLYFWRTSSGTEVDFVIYGPKIFLAIEVKAVKDVKMEHLSGLKSFAEDYPKAKRIFLYLGSEEKILKDVHCIPVEKFLKSLKI